MVGHEAPTFNFHLHAFGPKLVQDKFFIYFPALSPGIYLHCSGHEVSGKSGKLCFATRIKDTKPIEDHTSNLGVRFNKADRQIDWNLRVLKKVRVAGTKDEENDTHFLTTLCSFYSRGRTYNDAVLNPIHFQNIFFELYMFLRGSSMIP